MATDQATDETTIQFGNITKRSPYMDKAPEAGRTANQIEQAAHVSAIRRIA